MGLVFATCGLDCGPVTIVFPRFFQISVLSRVSPLYTGCAGKGVGEGNITQLLVYVGHWIVQLRPDLCRTTCPLPIKHFEPLETRFSPFGIGCVLYMRSHIGIWWPENEL